MEDNQRGIKRISEGLLNSREFLVWWKEKKKIPIYPGV